MVTRLSSLSSGVLSTPAIRPPCSVLASQRRAFHDYFITHLPSSSHHPDSRPPAALHHKLPRDKSTPHHDSSRPQPVSSSSGSSSTPPGISRDLTVVRIPLKSAKHHFGAFASRGQRPYNEDTFQAGTIELPAFTKRRPKSVRRRPETIMEEEQAHVGNNPADSVTGDPQVFYFGVFDGHGGNECSDFLRDQLHCYIENAAREFGIESTLKRGQTSVTEPAFEPTDLAAADEKKKKAIELEQSIVKNWGSLVGGYFRRFKPEFFASETGGQEHVLVPRVLKGGNLEEESNYEPPTAPISLATVLEWAFLKADYDFIAAQAAKAPKKDEDESKSKAEAASAETHQPNQSTDTDQQPSEKPSEASKKQEESLAQAADKISQKVKDAPKIGGSTRFLGGSTGSIALVSTPTPTPFWHPAASSTIVTAHCGDTRILLCDTASGNAISLTATHHPNHPLEAQRMRRYAATFVTDSFGEERVGGLANTRAFGDMPSKRIGVSAEPEIVRVEVSAAQFSFLVLTSDGVNGQLGDQEVVDIVKEARTPEQGAKDVVSFATEVTTDGDNATALVVRLGGWERRQEGGGGSLKTKEMRDFRRKEASDPRSRRT